MESDEDEMSIEQVISEERSSSNDINQVTTNHLERLGHSDGVAAGASGYLFGYTKLHVAASDGQVELLKSLLSDDSSNNDVNGKTVNGGYTALHLAASAGHVDCVEELLKCRTTNLHVTDDFGKTPLETAEQNSKSDAAKLLRSHGERI